MLEELHLRFPKADAFSCPWFFDTWKFELDGIEYNTKRGHGLGMANALTTLMQIIIEEMNSSRMENDTGLVNSFYNNDDAASVFKDEEDARRYQIIDDNTCTSLGLAYKPKSTFFCRQHLVFCENYVSVDEGINNKNTFAYMSLGILMKAINGSHARDLCLSLNLRNVRPSLVKEIVQYWGAVLFSNEFSRPRCAGGWFRNIEHGIDVSYIDENSERILPQMEEAAFEAYSNTKIEYFPWRRREYATKRSMLYPNEWLKQKGEKMVLTEKDFFRPMSQVRENMRAWRSFEAKLKLNFKKACRWWSKNPSRRRSWGDVYKIDADSRPKEDIIPPIFGRTETNSFEASLEDDVIFENPYRMTDHAIDLLSYRRGTVLDSYPRRMGMTERMFIGAKGMPNMKKGSAQRSLTLRHIYGVKKVPLKVWNIYLVPDQDTFKYWHNPFSVGIVADAYSRNYNSYIPKYVPEEKQKLLELRDCYYGRPLQWLPDSGKVGSVSGFPSPSRFLPVAPPERPSSPSRRISTLSALAAFRSFFPLPVAPSGRGSPR
jgi:hypothetical protein